MEGTARVLPRRRFQSLLDALRSNGFKVIGPTIRDGVIVLGDVTTDADLPVGWTDIQSGGEYRLKRRDDDLLFGFAVGPHSPKPYLFAPKRKLVSADKDDQGSCVFTEHVDEPEKLALLGVRPCDLAAMLIQDKVFIGGPYKDPDYARRRANTFVVAVNCSSPASTCFCASMGTGPSSGNGFDLAMTELYNEYGHEFLIEIGSESGAKLLDDCETVPATDRHFEAAAEVTARAEQSITKSMETADIRDRLFDNLEHPMWDDVATRCLCCANCTLVCPTCFCSTVEEVTDLTGKHAERWQAWDSCFTVDHSYIHGGSVRKSSRSRYRQWMTHKLASWIDQFGMSGCTGCGRCITWCPVGIDITEEVARLQ